MRRPSVLSFGIRSQFSLSVSWNRQLAPENR
jgi:hypothetical protein